jgi:hypothetical protein
MINGLSDHDGQLLIIKNIDLQISKHEISTVRIFNDQSMLNFKMQLSCKMWDDMFSGNDVDTILTPF